MKTKHIIYAISAFMVSIMSSCEDILDVKAPINQINSTQVYESVSTADAVLSNLYSEIQSYSLFSGGSSSAGALLGTYTDELISNNIFNQNASSDIFNNVQGATNTTIKGVWSNAYKEIYIANAIIEGVNNSSKIAELDKKRIKGEALFIRSFIYYSLSQIFGDIPYTITSDYKVNQSLYKTTELDVLIKIKKDLEESISLLNDNYRNPERIYPNKKTAELVLATVLMTQHQWEEAEKLLHGIVQNTLYVWQPDLSKTFKRNGKHILWQLKPLQAEYATNEALFYYFSTGVPTTNTISEVLKKSFDSNDLRVQNWIKTITVNQDNYYRNDKYKNISANTDEYSIVFRLEEAYLLFAEALVQQNKIAEALPYLNAVKQKAGISIATVSSSKEQLLNEILNENRKEFFSERGIRFVSLKRANRLNELAVSKPSWKTYNKFWPIPTSELIVNPKLNPQNDGY